MQFTDQDAARSGARRTGRRIAAASAVLATTATAWLALAGTASAHVPTVNATCADGHTVLSVDLAEYNGQGNQNTIAITDNAATLLGVTHFGTSYANKWTVSGAEDHTFVITVKAFDDPDGSHHWSFSTTKKVAACVAPPTTTTTTTTTTSSVAPTSAPTSAPVASSSVAAVTTTVAPTSTSAAAAALANTGASITAPLLIGVGLLGAGAVALVAVRRGRRTNA